MLFLTSPNNPDGSLPAPEEIEALLALPVLVVLDEAYIEFTDDGGRLGEELTRIRQVPQRENLVVLRTFSKWAGLAGLRVGYGAFPAWMLPALWKAKQPYNVNVAASAAALASLEDLEILASNVARIRAERRRLYAELRAHPVPEALPLPGQLHPLPVEGRSAAELKDRLAARRACWCATINTPLLQDYIRISVGSPQNIPTACWKYWRKSA